ncbi:MAG: SMP-30/gluconolactonase/LRE family protein [Robiginitomaculum sp.]|nr:SMP-30/gluconolactonase/LRE family protein [Robiginitomaculum sp.]MDQ7078890.1 SMP-30/gluconolactonase/LRE family protein [Robiginitomaculum sp.]
MGRLTQLIITAVIVLAVGVSYFWWTTLKWTGEMTSLRPHFNGQCQSVEGIVGAEDIVIDREQALAYISSHDRRNPETHGAIWVMALGDPQSAHKMKITGYDADLFAPHGIDLWIGKDGVRRLFVIEHGDWSQSRIIIFRIENGVLVFDHAVTDPLIQRPNDVAAAGENAFYTSNDLGVPYGDKRELLEVLLRQQKGNLVYFDGQKAQMAADHIGYANGVALSHDGSKLYLGAIIDQSVRFYDRDLKTGALTLRDKINLHTGVDNIDVDEDGVLWVAGHPKLLTFSKHAKDGAKRSPSQIIKIDPRDKTIREIYLSLGDPLSGASVGAHAGHMLLMGGVFDPRVLVCRLGSEPASSE